jgi:hypothetical protein
MPTPSWLFILDHLLPRPLQVVARSSCCDALREGGRLCRKAEAAEATSALALELCILTAAQSGEILGMCLLRAQKSGERRPDGHNSILLRLVTNLCACHPKHVERANDMCLLSAETRNVTFEDQFCQVLKIVFKLLYEPHF